MKLEHAVGLVLWYHGTRHDSLAGSHRTTVRALQALEREGVTVSGFQVEEGPNGPCSSEVSLAVERLMASGIIRRLSYPLHFGNTGLERLAARLRRLARHNPDLKQEFRAAIRILRAWHDHEGCRLTESPGGKGDAHGWRARGKRPAAWPGEQDGAGKRPEARTRPDQGARRRR